MFTGIVERTGRVADVLVRTGSHRIRIQVGEAPGLVPWRAVLPGESIAVDGVCLTLVGDAGLLGDDGKEIAFDAVPETLLRTTLGSLRPGDDVNLERSLRVGDVLGGHHVTGHVDGIGTVRSAERDGDQVLFVIEAPPAILQGVISKGSIAVDGISLTVIDVEPGAGTFSFAAIPHTLEHTTLRRRRPGSLVNLETDALGKWVLHAVAGIAGARGENLPVLLERVGRAGSGRVAL
ncbi:MAG TPA: riboflavin synthase [Planctomycetota bacterium]|nr:riboflavin synthase [Planctomycetota bacterium]